MGSRLWRVVFDMEDWESVNDNSDPNTFNWGYYNGVYANSKFQNLWGTIGYLNQKGISSGIALSFMGRVPIWMSGSGACLNGNGNNICVNKEDEWVEMIASLVYYARNTAHISFSQLDPINEPDWDGYEGPQVDNVQYARLLNKLSQKLDSLGLNDIKLLGPNTASIDVGVINYMPQMMQDSTLMSKVDHFGLHNYAGYSGNAAQVIRDSAYPTRNFYMTEITTPADILTVINSGPSAIYVWDGYDSVYNHAILAGRGSTPPNDAGDGPAPLAYDRTTGQYSPRKVFYQHEQLFKYVPSGSVRIAASQPNMSAFFHQQSGRVTLVGTNTSSGSISYTGTFANLPVMSALEFYWTSTTDPTRNFFREANITVTNSSFSFNAPANSTFTLTGFVTSADQTPPHCFNYSTG
jgi:O-glycosyl hydrolase